MTTKLRKTTDGEKANFFGNFLVEVLLDHKKWNWNLTCHSRSTDMNELDFFSLRDENRRQKRRVNEGRKNWRRKGYMKYIEGKDRKKIDWNVPILGTIF